MTINWAALALVAAATIVAAVSIVGLFSLGVAALTSHQRSGTGSASAVATVAGYACHTGSSQPLRAPHSNPLVGLANPAVGDDLHLPVNALADDPVPAAIAYRLIKDELMLDGSSRMNLATFVTTWMEPQALTLMKESADKNMIDKDEYPQTAEVERRCVAILADLWHAPSPDDATGCSTSGSSEACMLAGMALKRRWEAKVRAEGGDLNLRKPNLVMGANVQVCWEKFCRYWDVEPRTVPMDGEVFHLEAPGAIATCDENTIGVVAILGSTFDGSYEPVAEISAVLDRLLADGGPDIPVHVDGASGGMIAPFLDPDLQWTSGYVTWIVTDKQAYDCVADAWDIAQQMSHLVATHRMTRSRKATRF